MKALTIRQPWASLIMSGAKDIENRTWRTGVRGRIAIHSSATRDKREELSALRLISGLPEMPRSRYVRCGLGLLPRALRNIGTTWADVLLFQEEFALYERGVILGTVELVDCVVTSDSPWFTGPYGFVLRDPVLFETPIPAKGKLGFWEWGKGDEQADRSNAGICGTVEADSRG